MRDTGYEDVNWNELMNWQSIGQQWVLVLAEMSLWCLLPTVKIITDNFHTTKCQHTEFAEILNL